MKLHFFTLSPRGAFFPPLFFPKPLRLRSIDRAAAQQNPPPSASAVLGKVHPLRWRWFILLTACCEIEEAEREYLWYENIHRCLTLSKHFVPFLLNAIGKYSFIIFRFF